MPALSLSKLVDLALGTPEVGAVNFNILHSLLHAMIQHLKITDVTADINENDRDFLSGPEKLQLLSSLSADSGKDSQDTQDDNTDLRKHRPPYHQLENKVARLAEQLEQLNALPSTSELFQKIKATGDRPTPMQDLWQSMQISKRVGANEDGVGKLMTMVEDLMREMALLKDGYGRMDDLEEQMRKLRDENNNLKNKIDNLGMDDLLNRLNDLESYIKDLNEKFAQLPDLSHVPGPEEFAAFVTWPGLEDALNGVRSDFAELAARRATPPQSAHRPYQPQPVAHTQPEHAVPPQPAATAPAQPAAQPQSRPQTPHQQPPPPAQLPDTPAAPSPTFPSQTDVRSRPSSSRPSTRLSSASSGPSNQLLEILERLGKLVGSHEELEKRVEILEGDMKNKVDKDFLDRALKGLNMHLLGDLEEQLEQMKDDISNLQKQMQANREQIKPLGVVFDPASGLSSIHNIATPAKKASAMLPPLSSKPASEINSSGGLQLPGDTGQSELSDPIPAVAVDADVPGAQVEAKPSAALYMAHEVDYLGQKLVSLEDQMRALQEVVLGEGGDWLGEEYHPPSAINSTSTDLHSQSGFDSGVSQLSDQTNRPLRRKTRKTRDRQPPVDIHDSSGILTIVERQDAVEGNLRQSSEHLEQTNTRLLNLGKLLNAELRGLKERLYFMDHDFDNMSKGIEVALLKAQKSGATKSDLEALVRAQHAIQKLRDDVDNLQISTQEIISDNETKGKQIESLFVYCDKLQDVKADKEYVAMEVDVKADKRHLEGKVNHSLFDSATAEINRLIKEIQDKLNGNEFDWKDAIAKLSEELESKLDRMELNSLKEWLESRLKALNQKIKQTQRYDDDDAAGIRKQLLQRFHCISCDRPVDIMAAGPVPSIPASNGLPATRSPRPYTTYELDQIRQHAKSLQGGGTLLSSYPYMVRQRKDHVMGKNAANFERALAQRQIARARKTDIKRFMVQQYQHEACRGDVDELAGQEAEFYNPDRPCGGSHTLTYPHKRITKMAHMGNMYQSEPPVTPAPAPVAFKHDSELDILGVDGHIYKGRVDKADPSRRLVPNYTNMGVDRSPPMSPHVPIRPSTSNGSTKPTPTPVPPTGRPRPTSAVQRPTSSSSVARMTSSGRLTMRPQSARASSQGGSNSSSPPPEEPRQFVPAAEEQMSPEQGRVEEPEDAPEPVEIPGDTPREEVGQSATLED